VISPEAAALGIVATHLVIEDMTIQAAAVGLEDFRTALFESLRPRYTRGFVKRDPILAGFRQLRKQIGGSAQGLPCSTESLIRQLRRDGEIPSINPAVDIYNCVALDTRLTLGAHDLDRVEGEIMLTRSAGGEPFLPLGGGPAQTLGAGEYCYVDGSGDVLCRLDYKQAEKTRLTPRTRRALFILQGNPNTPQASVDHARTRLAELISRYCLAGGSIHDDIE
jgi:DNA/RNA-binding domain of Phe-tRNA-synthetase-like protein